MRIANLLAGSDNAAYPGLQVPASLVAPDTTVELVETGFYLDPYGHAAGALHAAGHVAAAIRAERDGFDAAFINSTSDYGLRDMRSIVGMPVVGAGEAGLKVAASLGRRFAVIQVWPAWARWIDEELLSSNGMSERCCAIRNVSNAGEEDDVHAAMIAGESGRAGMIARIVEAMQAAVRGDGADVLLLGCTCMSAAADELATQVEVPVVDPLKAAYLAAEQAARMGIKNTATGTPADERERLASAYLEIGALLADGRLGAGNQLDSCTVCAPIHPELLAELEAEQQSRPVTSA